MLEPDRPSRRVRHRKGKSDPLDAEAAARAVPGGHAVGQHKSGTGTAEMTRHLKAARDTAAKARTRAMLMLEWTTAPFESRSCGGRSADRRQSRGPGEWGLPFGAQSH